MAGNFFIIFVRWSSKKNQKTFIEELSYVLICIFTCISLSSAQNEQRSPAAGPTLSDHLPLFESFSPQGMCLCRPVIYQLTSFFSFQMGQKPKCGFIRPSFIFYSCYVPCPSPFLPSYKFYHVCIIF